MTLELQSVADAMGAPWKGERLGVSGWSVDTRTIEPGDLYFALRGPSNDGHDYVEEALRKGAVGVVVDHEVGDSRKALVVKDTLAALQSMARWARKRRARTHLPPDRLHSQRHWTAPSVYRELRRSSTR